MVIFRCPNCGQKIRVPDEQAGRSGRCPRCKSKVVIPPAGVPETPETTPKKPALSDLLDLSTPPQTSPSESQPEEVMTARAQGEQPPVISADPLTEVIEESSLPWFIDALAYPISVSGAVNIAVFVIVPLFVEFAIGHLIGSVASRLPLGGASYITGLLTLPFYIAFGCYVCYYVAHCVNDSSRGHRRASDIQIARTLDFGDLLSQVILLLACVAMACWPVAVYAGYIAWIERTEPNDLWYWLLGSLGIFFLPMSFLAGVIFDTFDALNPLLIVQSIGRTFLPYCGLVLFFWAVTALAIEVIPLLPIWGFVRQAIQIYLLLVLANSLGRFYWRHRDKLDWGI